MRIPENLLLFRKVNENEQPPLFYLPVTDEDYCRRTIYWFFPLAPIVWVLYTAWIALRLTAREVLYIQRLLKRHMQKRKELEGWNTGCVSYSGTLGRPTRRSGGRIASGVE